MQSENCYSSSHSSHRKLVRYPSQLFTKKSSAQGLPAAWFH